MKFRTIFTVLMLGGLLFSATVNADDAPKPRKKMQGKRQMQRGRQMRFDPLMMLALQVKDELKAYNENKTDENFKKLEEAVKKAAAEATEKRRKQLQNQLNNLEKNQQKTVGDFLEKAKEGDLKVPQMPKRPRGGKGGKRQKPNQD